MKKEKKKPEWQRILSTAFAILASMATGVALALGNFRFAIDSLPKLLFFLGALYVVMVLHVIIHEAGHLVFGLLTGYKFCSFRIFSFMWLQEEGKLKLKRHSLAGTGGQCLMAPPDMMDGKFPVFWYNMGGSILNLLTSALVFLIFLLVQDIPNLAHLLLIFSVLGFLLGILNGVPLRVGAVDNDGYNAIALVKNPLALEALWLQLKIAEQSAKGVRLKDMPEAWFIVPSDEDMKNSLVSARGVFVCNRLMDAGKFAEAEQLMGKLLSIESGMPELYRQILSCDRLFLELVGENRQEIVAAMQTKGLQNFRKAMKRYPGVLRTEYALALRQERDIAKAQKCLAQFENIAKTYPYPQEIEAERELIEAVNNA